MVSGSCFGNARCGVMVTLYLANTKCRRRRIKGHGVVFRSPDGVQCGATNVVEDGVLCEGGESPQCRVSS